MIGGLAAVSAGDVADLVAIHRPEACASVLSNGIMSPFDLHLFETLGDSIAVDWAQRDSLEDQHVQRAGKRSISSVSNTGAPACRLAFETLATGFRREFAWTP